MDWVTFSDSDWATMTDDDWAGMTLYPPDGAWDLEAADIFAPGAEAGEVSR